MCFEKVYSANSVEIIKLTDQIYFRYVSWDDHQQCNGGYIIFKDCVAVVDAPGIEGANEMLAEVAMLFGKPVKYVFLTHGHWDHIDGLPVFTEIGTTIIGSGNMIKKLKADGIKLSELSVGVENTAYVVIDGVVLEPFTIPGAVHSAEDILIAFPSENIVFTGDVVADLSNLVFDNGDFNNWLAALDTLEAKKFNTVCVGHGQIKDNSYFSIQRAYFNALNNAVAIQSQIMGRGMFFDKSEDAPAKFAKAACHNANNAGAQKAIEMAGITAAENHISALIRKRLG